MALHGLRRPRLDERGGVARNLLGVLATGVLVAVVLVAGGVFYLQSALSRKFDEKLRRDYFNDPARASFERSGVDLFRGRVSIEGLQLKNTTDPGTVWLATAKAAVLEVPPLQLLSGQTSGRSLRITEPELSIAFSSVSYAVESDSASLPPLQLPWLSQLPIQELSIVDGAAHLQSPGGQPFDFTRLSARARLGGAGEPLLDLHAEGQPSGSPSARLLFNAKIWGPEPGTKTEGELRFSDVPIAAIAAVFPPDKDVAYKSGTLSLNSQFNVAKDWLTASHLVEIKNFKAEVSPSRDELFGVPTKYLKDLLDIDHLSFVLPMTGGVRDPQIGVSSSVDQILFKILEAKFSDKDKAAKWAKYGGDRFGKKIDKALKRWLSEKR